MEVVRAGICRCTACIFDCNEYSNLTIALQIDFRGCGRVPDLAAVLKIDHVAATFLVDLSKFKLQRAA